MDDDTKKAAIITALVILVMTILVMFMSLRAKPLEESIESSMEANGSLQN